MAKHDYAYNLRSNAVVICLCMILSVCANLASAAPDDETAWHTTWLTPLIEPTFLFDNPGNYGFEDKTLRMRVYSSIGGEALRLRITNRFGNNDLEIGSVAVAKKRAPYGPQIHAETVRHLTFSGARSVRIKAGEDLTSDPIEFFTEANEVLLIDIYLPSATGSLAYNFLTASTHYLHDGNVAGVADWPYAEKLGSWYLVDRVEVFQPQARGVVVVCCDSVSMTGQSDAFMRWPEVLSRRLAAAYGSSAPSVVMSNLSGQRLLTSSNYAPSVLERFQRDVLEVHNLSKVILLVGVNDLGFPSMPDIAVYSPNNDVNAESMIQGFIDVAKIADKAGVKVITATLTPGYGYRHLGHPYWSPEQEEKRRKINEWLRSSQVFERVVDFAAVVQNPLDDRFYLPWASSDNIHPSDGGQFALGMSIDLDHIYE